MRIIGEEDESVEVKEERKAEPLRRDLCRWEDPGMRVVLSDVTIFGARQ